MATPTEAPADYRQHLEVETPEQVALDLEIAGIGSRTLAGILDLLILGGGTLGVFLVIALFAGFGMTVGRWGQAVLLLGGFLAWTGYFILFEGMRGGQTPGKRIAGIRVLMDTGHAVTPGAAAVRNLIRLADFLPPPYLLGVLLIAFHPRGKRLGDLVAGTVVARDPPEEAARAPRSVPSEAPAPSLPDLGDPEFNLLSRFVSRRTELSSEVRARLAADLAARLSAWPPPPGVSEVEHLVALHGRELARREDRLASHSRAGAATRFVATKRARWDAFHLLAQRASRNGLDSFASHELPDFAARYREVAADLARARTYGLEGAELARLERLAASGHNSLYRDEGGAWGRLWLALARDCPRAMLQARGYVLAAFLAFMAPAAAGFALLHDRPALAAELLPEVLLRRADAGVFRKAAGEKYLEVAAEDRPLVASGIITNNVRIAIACFAGGVFAGVGSLVLLAFNGLLIGASAGHFANLGLLDYLLEFIAGHGLLELIAIWVAGAAGLLLGRSVVAPGNVRRADALVVSGGQAVRMLGATAMMLVVSGLIEGFISAAQGGLAVRLVASAASLGFLGLYLANGVRTRPSSDARGSPDSA